VRERTTTGDDCERGTRHDMHFNICASLFIQMLLHVVCLLSIVVRGRITIVKCSPCMVDTIDKIQTNK
jgi:hypothetical protein